MKNTYQQEQDLEMTGNNNRPRLLKSQSGQVAMEAVLLAVVSMGLLGATLRFLRDDRTLDKLTNVAWSGVANMTEYGKWPGSGPGSSMHPNNSKRVRTLIP